jgi:hypothetical protein
MLPQRDTTRTGWWRAALIVLFVLGLSSALLAAIRFIWGHPAVIGPFALMIGMTPLESVFAYSLPVPGYVFVLGLGVGFGSWSLIRRWRPTPSLRTLVRAVAATGACLCATFVVALAVAAAYYGAGVMGGDAPPPGYETWIRIGARTAEVGIVLLLVALAMKLTLRSERRPSA